MYTQHTIINIKIKSTEIISNTIWSAATCMRFFSQGLKNGFEIAVVNESPVFELLKFYCICYSTTLTTLDYIRYFPFLTKPL